MRILLGRGHHTLRLRRLRSCAGTGCSATGRCPARVNGLRVFPALLVVVHAELVGALLVGKDTLAAHGAVPALAARLERVALRWGGGRWRHSVLFAI